MLSGGLRYKSGHQADTPSAAFQNQEPVMPSFASATRRFWDDYRRAAAERTALRRLSGMSDDLLRDIGLDRGNLRDAIRRGR